MGQGHSSEARGCEGLPVIMGCDVLSENSFSAIKGKRVGLIANSTSVLRDWTHLADALARSPNASLVAIFAPEHGFRGTAQAGSSESSCVDAATRVPVFDMYRKTPHQLSSLFDSSGVDTLVFDIQDVGARFYTYIWTLYDCLEGAMGSNAITDFLVLDRPNPLGGTAVDGPLMRQELASFVGRKAIPVRHGMTVGELALLFWNEFLHPQEPAPGKPSLAQGRRRDYPRVEVIKMKQWRRDSLPFLGCNTLSSSTPSPSSHSPTSATCSCALPWVPPSPNMPTPSTAILYVGTCLFEAMAHAVACWWRRCFAALLFQGTNCSEGRGTCLPFAQIGAPFTDARFAEAARREVGRAHGDAVLIREAHFVPMWGAFKGQNMCGVHIHVNDPRRCNPLHLAITLLCILRRLYPADLLWRRDRDGSHWVDRLAGTPAVRQGVDTGQTPDEIVASWQRDLLWFHPLRQGHLLY